MKRNAYLKDENLLTLFSLHNFVVPEIQREYVWGNEHNQETVLKPFLESLKKSANVEICHHAHSKNDVHIGFLYSYNPIYSRDEQCCILDENLIDGQQRFTTLFLLLLSRAVREKRMPDFLNLIRWDDQNIAFDYKVRNLTHMFLFDLIRSLKRDDEGTILTNIISGNYPNWLMRDYQEDVTIHSMIGALKVVQQVFDNSEDLYFDYFLSRIRFWHFKTDVTFQGEELYITMNSRGEELSGNESTKAKIFLQEDQRKWGPKWEEWQTFFWHNRKRAKSNNENADRGFNNFLLCCDAMSKQMGLPENGVNEIELFLEAFQHVDATSWVSILQKNCVNAYFDWIEEFKDLVWNRVNTANEKWTIDNTKNDTSQQERAALLWPWLYYYYYSKKMNKSIDDNTLIRLLHICYLNAKAGNRKFAGIKSFIEELVNHIPSSNQISMFELHKFVDDGSFLSNENKELSNLYMSSNSLVDAYEMEATVWKIQSEPFFLDGNDVGDTTIIDYIKEFQILIQKGSKSTLKNFVDNLYANVQNLFPKNKLRQYEVVLKRALLFYELSGRSVWKMVPPNYYRNYEINEWKRIIRGKGFIAFYLDMIDLNQNKVFTENDVQQQLIKKQNDFFVNKPEHQNFVNRRWTDCEIAILYDFLTQGQIWQTANKPNITFIDDGGLYPDWPNLYNTAYKKRRELIKLPSNWQNKLSIHFPQVQFVF